MSAAVARAVGILELLVGEPSGVQLGRIATELDLPKSAVHRILSELVELGYARVAGDGGVYALSLRLVAHALRHLESIPLVELATPLLDDLARASGELVRLSIPDDAALVWVGKSQGSKSGLKYDPDVGREVALGRTATGLAWLSSMADEHVRALLESQPDEELNWHSDRDEAVAAAMAAVADARNQGFSYTDSTYEPGIAAIALPVAVRGQEASAVLSIAGPSMRLSKARAVELLPALMSARDDLLAFGGSLTNWV